jgi:hypothetical protein
MMMTENSSFLRIIAMRTLLCGADKEFRPGQVFVEALEEMVHR